VQGFHKAVKKHDKQLPHAPCQQFYMHILRTQPWVQGDQSSLLIKLSAIYAQLRGQPADTAVEQVWLIRTRTSSASSPSLSTACGPRCGPLSSVQGLCVRVRNFAILQFCWARVHTFGTHNGCP